MIALFGMLFMQLAVASYACPGLTMGQGNDGAIAMSAASVGQNMAGCQGMDDAQPNPCQAYGQVGNQLLDKPDLPQVQPFVAIGLALPLLPIDVTAAPTAIPVETAQLSRSTAPPLAIRNCCFRI